MSRNGDRKGGHVSTYRVSMVGPGGNEGMRTISSIEEHKAFLGGKVCRPHLWCHISHPEGGTVNFGVEEVKESQEKYY